jgi:hypothetical protein
MRAIRRFALLALILSAACFARRIELGSDENWYPVRLPFPAQGLQVAWPFHIAAGGDFALEVSLPQKGPNGPSAELPTIYCDLVLEIVGKNGTTVQQSIKWLNSSSSAPWSHMDSYGSTTFTLPKSGDYMFHFRNQGEAPFLCSQGADIALSRQVSAYSLTTRGQIFELCGSLLLFFGFFAALTSEVQDYRRRRAITKDA